MKKILVIEDEPQVRENIRQVLALSEFEVSEAGDGQAGLEMAIANPPSIIICDITMPKLDGYGVLKALRQNLVTASIPLIFLTAKADRCNLRQGMEMGADDYLTKPFTLDELLRAVTIQLEKQAANERRTQIMLNELRNCIASALPHELMTPLNGILGSTQLLIDYHNSLEPNEQLELTQALLSSGNRLHNLVERFLLYTNLELIAREPKRIQCLQNGINITSTKDCLAEVALQKAQTMGREADLSLKLQYAILQISPQDLKRFTEEVLDNAFKFSQPGTSVQVIGQVSNHHFCLSILDQGWGMTTGQIAKIGAYTQFERNIHEQQGAGLGLAIAKRVVELYGGEFSIESIPGKQTVVQATFRLHKESLPPKDLLDESMLDFGSLAFEPQADRSYSTSC